MQFWGSFLYVYVLFRDLLSTDTLVQNTVFPSLLDFSSRHLAVLLTSPVRGHITITMLSRLAEGVITEGVLSLEKSQESLNSLDSLENGWILLHFPHAGGSLETLESLNSLELSEKTPLLKDPLF